MCTLFFMYITKFKILNKHGYLNMIKMQTVLGGAFVLDIKETEYPEYIFL